ncbi:hypothetical protein F889_03080 [Acinetobacter colistiniresistens]|uniref:Uncharacterized protein n=1 Tax=Acinetobacter colistiniresistens TaxID=280145 RepID=N9R3F0_9GAMM|nr:hypothetical protein [Acinetobacter colistiniresistens]ENX33145.1 hypothetical protein F889_03080 [Acinetobacter colistiniresistens]
MLPTKILKLRLLRIQKGKEHLSAQEKLMLVTMESPDLSAHFLLRLFKVTLPKQWQFRHESDEDILYASQLIQLIEDELLSAYESHARKYAWYEQCLVYRLNFIVTRPNQQHINGYLRRLDRCLDQQPKIDLLHYFQQHYPSAQHAIALAKAYAGATQYSQAIEYYEWAAQQSQQRNETAFYAYIDCLLSRNQPEYQPQLSDVEYALHLLLHHLKPIDQKNQNQRLQRAVSLLLPESILRTRAANTHLLADLGRGLNSLGKSLNGIFGAKQAHLPFSQEVIATASQLLTEQSVLTSLVQQNTMQAAWQRVLAQDTTSTGQADLPLIYLWQVIQQNAEILRLLQTPVQYEVLRGQLRQTDSKPKRDFDLGQIQLILQQGLMAYLGDIRLNKQHPERNALYLQRDLVIEDMIAFAVWFNQEVLASYLQQQSQQFEQVQNGLRLLDASALVSHLFALQFEMHKRVQDLADWMTLKLAKGSEFEQMQAAWVALRELSNFGVGQEKVQQLESILEQYKVLRLEQIQTLSAEDGQEPLQADEP